MTIILSTQEYKIIRDAVNFGKTYIDYIIEYDKELHCAADGSPSVLMKLDEAIQVFEQNGI